MVQNTSAEEVIQVFKNPFKGRGEKRIIRFSISLLLAMINPFVRNI